MSSDKRTLAVLLAALVVGSVFAVTGMALAQTGPDTPGNEPETPGEEPTPAPSNELTVVELSAPDSVAPNSTVEVAATLANAGNESVTESVEFRVGGAVVADERVTVAPGEQTTVTFAADTTGLGTGDVLHGVLTENDGAFARLTISESFTVSNLIAPANATTGSTVTVAATVTNPNDFETTQTVEFRFAGVPLFDESLTLGANERQDLTIDASLEGVVPGTYVHGILTRDLGQLATIEVMPNPATVSMANQTTDGQTVVVENVTVPEGGFIAIHNASLLDGNVVGSVIGVSEKLEPGTHENVTITLFEVPGGPTGQNLTENQTLIAMPHMDTNDNDVYDFVTSEGEVDGPYVVDGAAVTDTANVTVEMAPTEPSEPASVSMANQTSNGTTVVVENVTVPEGGFIAIHNASLLDGNVVGSVIGVSEKLEPGTHENVTVTLFEVPGGPTGQNLTENQTLIAMPHMDTNDNGVYDFVTSEGEVDGPYVVNGTVVTDTANVTVEMAPTEPPAETPGGETPTETPGGETPTETPGGETPTETPGGETPTASLGPAVAALL